MLTARDWLGNTALILAVNSDPKAVSVALHPLQVTPLHAGPFGWQIERVWLHSAAAARQIGIARLLIARGAKVNALQAESGFTPLHEIAVNGDLKFAKLLLEHGAK